MKPYKNSSSSEASSAAKALSTAVSKFTENRRLPVRTAGRSALQYFDDAALIWKILLVSLPIDLLIVSLQVDFTLTPRFLEFLNLASLSALLLSAVFLFRESLLGNLDKLQSFQLRAMRFSTQHSRAILTGIVLLTASEIVIHFGGFGLIAIIPGSILLIRAAQAMQRTLKEQQAKFSEYERDQVILMEALNRRLFIVSLFPIISARVGSACAAVAILSTSHSIVDWLPYGVAALVLLSTFCPQVEDFITRCPKCSRWTSRALKSKGICPVCTREEFQIKETEAKAIEKKELAQKAHAERLKALTQFLTRLMTSASKGKESSTPSTSSTTALSKS